MHRDTHLDFGTRVINAKDGRLGNVVEAHYLARPSHDEITIQYDGSEGGWATPRADIEYEGTEWFVRALKRWGRMPEEGNQESK